MFIATFEEIIESIGSFGNDVFEKTVGLINNLPGIAKGLASAIIVILTIIGTLTLLKKSFKVFGIILIVLILLVIVLSLIK